MTQNGHSEIRRCADGTIDFDFYDARARALRAHAMTGSLAQMQVRSEHSFRSAIRSFVDATRSIVMTMPTELHTRAGKPCASDRSRG